MKTIAINTLNGAVTEYTRHEFHSLTPTHAGAAWGLFELSGDSDSGQPIQSRVRWPERLQDTPLKKPLVCFYISGSGEGGGQMWAEARGQAGFAYDFPLRAAGVSRATVGRGLRGNYTSFGFSKPDGRVFEIDRVEAMFSPSTTRRLGS